jgi:PEP-CTERM motif
MRLPAPFRVIACVMLAVAVSPPALGITVDTFYSGEYAAASIGSVPGVPTSYGGITFVDSNTVIIGGAANTAGGLIYQIDVTRDANNHITGFSGTATPFRGGTIGEFNDGGVVFGPGGVLFTSRWPVNELGQTLPGSTDENRIIDLASLGVTSSHAAVNFVPEEFAGAGGVKLVSWEGGQWYEAELQAAADGTFDLLNIVQVDLDPSTAGIDVLPGGPEGFVYIASGNPLFDVDSMLVAEFSAGRIGVYELDANGNPLIASRRDFITDLTGAEGATIDPVTGDFLFSTFGGSNQIVVVQGFIPPDPDPVPEPGTLLLFSIGLLGLRVVGRRVGD